MASKLSLNLFRRACPQLRASFSTKVTVPSNLKNDELVTHTGQQYEVDDFRRDRFENARRVVNEKFAIDLVKEDPIVVCEQRSVWSSGGGAMGHPKIFINLDKDKIHICGYSGRRFIKRKFFDEAKHGKSVPYSQYLEEMKKKEHGDW